MFYGKRSSVFEQQQNHNPAGKDLSIALIGHLHTKLLLRDIAEYEPHPDLVWIQADTTPEMTYDFVSILQDTVIAMSLSDQCFKLTLRDHGQLYCHKVVYALPEPESLHHNEELLWQNMISQGFIDAGDMQAKPALKNKLFMLPAKLSTRNRRALISKLLTHP